jgi:hypothetical protein
MGEVFSEGAGKIGRRKVVNPNMGPDKQETGRFHSNYPGGQMS